MPRTERDRELARRRTRKVKLQKLIGRYAQAVGVDKEAIAAKVRRLSPFFELDARVAELKAAGKLVAPKTAKK